MHCEGTCSEIVTAAITRKMTMCCKDVMAPVLVEATWALIKGIFFLFLFNYNDYIWIAKLPTTCTILQKKIPIQRDRNVRETKENIRR